MRLLIGPAGSGKTTWVLDRLREALRAGDESVRLLAPTATLAQHLQNRIAREGFVLRRGLVQTLSAFIDPWCGELRQVSEPALYLIVEEIARRVDRPEFARVADTPGFCASLARTIEEFSSAGCDSARLAECLPDAPLAAAFLAVYREVDRELERRGLAMRGRRLEFAARRIEREGLPGIRTIWLDGFYALPDPELALIGALARRAEVVVTWPGDAVELVGRRGAPWARLPHLHSDDDLLGFEVERLARRRPEPAMMLARAPSIEREAEEIARRIVEQAAAGRPFREMGIVVRAPETYAPVLRTALERFGIPARFYFDSRLHRHPAVRYLTGAVDAMLGGWDHARTLAVLRLAPRFADSAAMDRFDFEVRAQIPNAGLGPLKALLMAAGGEPLSSGAERLLRKIDRLGAIEEWRSFSLSPAGWAERMRALRGLYRVARPPEGGAGGSACQPMFSPLSGHQTALEWRSQGAALDLFDEALEEAASALDPGRLLSLEEFWRPVKAILRLKPLRLADGRRNVVHVLSAPEARQWELPVVFVCGMTEKGFPKFHPQDPFFPDAARCRLNDAGVRVRTAAEFEREERALFESAISRGSMQVTLSYPEFDARGERNLPSIFLEDLALEPEQARRVRPGPRRPLSWEPSPAGIRAPALLRVLREKTGLVSPTALEKYLQCPFQFFGARVLRLAAPPPRPQDRLDFAAQGEIVHAALAQWYASPQDMGALFERIFEGVLEERNVPHGYHVERLRNAMLEDLRAFAADARWPRADFASQTECDFEFALNDSVRVRGKIDRLDIAPDGRAWVVDYKYSGAQRTRQRLSDENLLQAPLYYLAAEKFFGARPAGMFFIALKGGVSYAGWSHAPVGDLRAEPIPERWAETAAERALRAVEEIRAGRVVAAPGEAQCEYCDFRDICRKESPAAEAQPLAEGA
jgi:putative RecB family exonuclease